MESSKRPPVPPEAGWPETADSWTQRRHRSAATEESRTSGRESGSRGERPFKRATGRAMAVDGMPASKAPKFEATDAEASTAPRTVSPGGKRFSKVSRYGR